MGVPKGVRWAKKFSKKYNIFKNKTPIKKIFLKIKVNTKNLKKLVTQENKLTKLKINTKLKIKINIVF